MISENIEQRYREHRTVQCISKVQGPDPIHRLFFLSRDAAELLSYSSILYFYNLNL